MSTIRGKGTSADTTDGEPGNFKTITKCGRTISLPGDKALSEYSMFYIGGESLTLNSLIYNFQSSQFFSYNPFTKEGRRENVNVNKLLMKRYFMVEKAKDAKIVGILIGTLGVANYSDMLNRLKVLTKKAGKKSYVFIVGKINVPKLANFMEIDVFVLIACAENTLLDSSEFYKPVITPYEMELACNTEREWTGEYPTDFGQLLEGKNEVA
jgi:diphthamide biosynthesis protein 2